MPETQSICIVAGPLVLRADWLRSGLPEVVVEPIASEQRDQPVVSRRLSWDEIEATAELLAALVKERP